MNTERHSERRATRTRITSALGGLASLALIASAPASDAQTQRMTWGEAGNWTILIDPDVGNGCYMERTLEDGTLVQVGMVPIRDGGFVALYNPAWTAIEDGVVGTVQFDFGTSLFGGDYVGVVEGDLFGGYAFFNNPAFVSEFGRRNSVVIKGDKGATMDISLAGTAKAINAVRSCHAEQQ